jgi:hypothetical protein
VCSFTIDDVFCLCGHVVVMVVLRGGCLLRVISFGGCLYYSGPCSSSLAIVCGFRGCLGV